jgi:hypothetical protein
LYGRRIRQPIGGDFGLSNRLVERYLSRQDWETDIARYGIDIWMTTIAVAEDFKTCQSFLGAKLHDAKDPGADLSAMLHQVVGSVFTLMREYETAWQPTRGSVPVDLYGFPYDVGLDPIEVNVERMLGMFRAGCEDLREIWSLALAPAAMTGVRELAADSLRPERFHMRDELWAQIIYDFACAHKQRPLERMHLLRSLTPLYLGRVASFVLETREMFAADVEDRIERLCLTFENLKPYLESRWRGGSSPPVPVPERQEATAQPKAARDRMEVES